MKWIKRLFGKKRLISKKELVYLCCANCEDFESSKKRKGWGFCPGIYWPYDILSIKEESFCKNFRIKMKWSKKYRVDKKSRPKEVGLIQRILAAGICKRSAMINDSVMLTSTTKF